MSAALEDICMDAECRYLGVLLSNPALFGFCPVMVSPQSFQSELHAAIYFAVLPHATASEVLDPAEVWSLVSDCPDAEIYGEGHIRDLIAAAPTDVATYLEDIWSLVAWSSAVFGQLMAPASECVGPKGLVH